MDDLHSGVFDGMYIFTEFFIEILCFKFCFLIHNFQTTIVPICLCPKFLKEL